MSKKYLAWILIGISLNLDMNLGGDDVFTMLILPIHEHGFSLHLFYLDIKKILSSVFCGFPHTNPVHALLCIPEYFIFLSNDTWYYT